MGGNLSAPGGDALHDRLRSFFAGLRPRSRVSLQQALDIHATQGVGATLVIQIPADPAKPVEVFLSTAPVQLVADLSKLA